MTGVQTCALPIYKHPKYLGVDVYPGEGVDYVGDFLALDIPSNSVGVIRAVDFLEHIPNKIAVMNKIWDLLAHGGMLLSLTPSTDGRGAWQDPTHVAGWNENSFWYFTDDNYRRFVPDVAAKFHPSRVVTYLNRKSTRLNSSHIPLSRMPSSA